MKIIKGFLITLGILFLILCLLTWHPWNPPINLRCVSYDGTYEISIRIENPYYSDHLIGSLLINDNTTGKFIMGGIQGITFQKDNYFFRNAYILGIPSYSPKVFLLNHNRNAVYWDSPTFTEKLLQCFPAKF